MGSKCNPRDCYDLCYRRHRIKCRVGVEESQDKMEARKKENERTSSLNEISETLREVLKKNDALASAINLGTHLLQGADSKSLPALQERPLTPRPSRPDTDVEDAVIRARLDSASHLAKVLVDSLEQINKAILQPNINSPRPSQKPTSQEPTVFYRVCDRISYTSHDFGLAFWSARGLPDHDFGDPVEQEFRAHVAGEHTLPKPFAERGRFKSPYISLTTDPGFACKFGTKYDGQFVFEIDAVKLRRMGVHVESTVDIADRWRVPYRGSEPRLHYVFPSHWLARFWIPKECMKPHSFTQFRDKCRKSGFFNGMFSTTLLCSVLFCWDETDNTDGGRENR